MLDREVVRERGAVAMALTLAAAVSGAVTASPPSCAAAKELPAACSLLMQADVEALATIAMQCPDGKTPPPLGYVRSLIS